jgi:nitroreductase/Pyruvate/2-oxoacid:ferredoxin oxidoreductase delta subunit
MTQQQEGCVIVVNTDKCEGCGQCVRICHEHCMALINDRLSIDYEYCSTCTQCVAVCARQALSWDGVPAVAYDESLLPSPEQLEELFKERRTIRYFRRDKIDRTLLEEIVGYGVYAPTNNFELRAIVVDDEETIDDLDLIIQQWNARIYNAFYKPRFVHALLRRFWPKRDYLEAKPKLEAALDAGRAIRRLAAMIFIVGDKRTPLSVDSAQYALYNMMLYAQVKGIGTCLWGPGRLFLNRNRAARELLGLGKHEQIFGSILVGYPTVRFRNKVEGKTLSIQWR